MGIAEDVFIKAGSKGDLERIKTGIQEGININAQDRVGGTTLKVVDGNTAFDITPSPSIKSIISSWTSSLEGNEI